MPLIPFIGLVIRACLHASSYARKFFDIRDINDHPVLYTAIIENIDIFITGDKDFLDVEIEMPEIMTPREFLERVIKNS